MSNKQIILVTTIILFLSIAVWVQQSIVGFSPEGAYIVDGGFGLAFLIALYLLVSTGTVTLTAYWKWILAGVFALMIGIVFKILHLSYADEAIMIGYFIIATSYLIRFILKKLKNHLDVLKVIWVVYTSVTSALFILHFIPREAPWFGKVLFWITFYDFVYLELKKSPPSFIKK